MAKAVLVPNAIVLEVLNKHNYVDWSEIVQSYLEANGLWDVVKPSNPDDRGRDRDRDETWRKKNAAALHAIKISCGPDTLSVIRGIRSAKAAWDKLEAKFKPQLPIIVKSLYRTGRDHEKNTNNGHDKQYEPAFFDALRKKDWKTVQELYTDNPNLLKASLPLGNIPALHQLMVEAQFTNNMEDMVVEILRTAPMDALEMRNFFSATSLAAASVVGIIRFAECIVERRSDLLSIPNAFLHIPLVAALAFGQNHMARYLYYVTPLEVLLSDHGKHGATLITKSIELRNFDIAIHLLRRHPELTFAKDIYGKSPVYAVACSPSLFRSGHGLRFWQLWKYNQATLTAHGDGARENCDGASRTNEPFPHDLTASLQTLRSGIISRRQAAVGARQDGSDNGFSRVAGGARVNRDGDLRSTGGHRR
ncbi:hypothetical protein TIFTF001_035186 [Ficus carica]|uniref:DUF4219 domain-containing protein n=1 Tax=Ficus carica TaxID=3494 RepID=A0AA88J660_FICCA|nr:hypothetical protein TIFTF001_035176 [Ficus carica]GMN66123.1 hypothetical protein TIFTF001_035186 [Ficus carica]